MRPSKVTLGRASAILIGLPLVLLCLVSACKTAGGSGGSPSPSSPGDSSEAGRWGLYSPDPAHVWNRLYRSLYLRVARDGREYGYDELDPLLWPETTYLLGGPSYRQAVGVLDEFLDTHAERLISDPLKRAVLQRDLWAVFDWTVERSESLPPEGQNLQVKLAQVIRRLALSAEEIRSLPDNYRDAVAAKTFAACYDPEQPGAAFLPSDLFTPGGPWVPLSAVGGGPVAPGHVAGFDGRSAFLIFIRLPEGREATLAYLRKLSDFPRPWIRDRRNTAEVRPNPELPQFPVGTQLALVRQMMLIDDRGNLTPTSLTEEVQVRVHRAIPVEIPEGFNADRDEALKALEACEFRLSRAKLFAGDAGGLRPAARDEKEFPIFASHGIDLFDTPAGGGSLDLHLRPVLSSCSQCHFRPGVHSVLSRQPDITLLRVRDVRRDLIPSRDSQYEAAGAKNWKLGRRSWKRLQELWPTSSVTTTQVTDTTSGGD
jgi:hypothetical protein